MSEPPVHNEAVLLAQLRQGDQAAFQVIYQQYWRPLFVMAYNRIKLIEDAEDLVSEVFLHLWHKAPRLDIHTSLSHYLAVSVKHRVLDYFRSQKVRQQYAQSEPFNAATNPTEEKLSFEELYHLWEQETNQLPEQCRIVYVRSKRDHLSTREIAQEMALSERTVEHHLYRAHKILKLKLKDFAPVLVTAISSLFNG